MPVNRAGLRHGCLWPKALEREFCEENKMRLSRKKAIELCMEHWTWCAKTGKDKRDWPKLKEFDHRPMNDCFFCEYDKRQCQKNISRNFEGDCRYCPFIKKLNIHCSDTFYRQWHEAKTITGRRKYAKLFLERQIKKCV